MDTLLQADFVFPIEGPPIQNGAVWISDGLIRAVGTAAEVEASIPDGVPVQWISGSNAAILPGFVNTHAHLELSALKGQIPRPAKVGEDFTGWIRRVLSLREQMSPEDFRDSVHAGIRQLVRGGTTTVGDITSNGCSLIPLVERGPRAVVFREVLGFGADREQAARQTCKEWLDQSAEIAARSEGRVTLGLSPHATHSTSPAIYRDCCQQAAEANCLIATHISETREEMEFMVHGSGVFRKLLDSRGHSLKDWKPPGVSPLQYLHDLGVLRSPGLAIHNNYLLPGDLSILAGSHLTPVYCPQSHLFLGHSDHPAALLLEQNTPLALGTDSLASTDSLNMLDELRLVHRQFPEVKLETWLRCATLGGAEALRLDGATGSLQPGKAADITVIALPTPANSRSRAETTLDPHDLLVAPGAHVVATMVQGEWLLNATC